VDDVTRKESSVPVQTRVSIVDLAKMDWYWLKTEGVHIKSMSQLVSWTFTALVDILESNEKMPKGDLDSVLGAHKYLSSRGLYQSSLKKRSEARIVAALGFENLRKQGSDPAMHGSIMHKVMHSEHSIDVVDRQIDHGGKCSITDEEWDEMQERIAEEKKKEEEATTKKAIVDARASGMIVDDEEWIKERQEKDKEIIERENAPLKPEDFDLVKE